MLDKYQQGEQANTNLIYCTTFLSASSFFFMCLAAFSVEHAEYAEIPHTLNFSVFVVPVSVYWALKRL